MEQSERHMLKISKTPTTRAGKPAGAALLAEARLLIQLETVFPVIGQCIIEHSSPKHRKAIVDIVRSAADTNAAHALAKLLDAGNTSAFLQKFEGVFVGVSQPAEAHVPTGHAAMLAALGIKPDAEDVEAEEEAESDDSSEETDTDEGKEAE